MRASVCADPSRDGSTIAFSSLRKETQRLAREQPHMLKASRTVTPPESPGAGAGLISSWDDGDVVCEEIGENKADTIYIC
jgi:hypothetical protein